MRRITLVLALIGTVACLAAGNVDVAAQPPPAQLDGSRLDVRSFGADLVGGKDDTAALNAAIARANVLMAHGIFACLYIAAGTLTVSSQPTAFVGPGCVEGDGQNKSFIKLTEAFTGDLFRWSDAWAGGSYLPTNTSLDIAHQHASPRVTGLTITGSRKAPGPQNGLMFYDRTDFATIEDVGFYYLPGRAIAVGLIGNGQQAFQRESHWSNIRAFNSGAPGLPVIEISAQCRPGCGGRGTIDGSNLIDIEGMNIFSPHGPGLVIRSLVANAVVRGIRINGLRVEGMQNNPEHLQGDLVQIGDHDAPGRVANIIIDNANLVSPYAGYAALRISGPKAGGQSTMPYDITFTGSIIAGAGKGSGIVIEAGRLMRFMMTNLQSVGPNITIASSATVGPPIVFDGFGAGQNWTYKVDPSVVKFIRTVAYRIGLPAPPTSWPRQSATRGHAGNP